jgi:hypothetical protein
MSSGPRRVSPSEYIQLHEKNWDLDFMVVMPGEAGKQLFKEYPLSEQSVVARAHGRKGGKAGKGKPKTGKKAAKGMAKTGRAAKGSKKTGKAAKGMAKTGRAAKGVANWRAGGGGVMQTPQELLLAFQQEMLGYQN